MSPDLEISIEGRLGDLDAACRGRLTERSVDVGTDVSGVVSEVIRDVARHGDEALIDTARRFDGVDLGSVEVPRQQWSQALERSPRALVDALEQARDAIATFHRDQLPTGREFEIGPGIRLGRRPEPLRRVGAYAPGGRAAYPSSVLMCVVPAKLAGVAEVVVCSPPQAGGAPSDVVLAACELGGADRVFAVGGAAAVAALAYGTATIPRADKVVGPGNAYVTEAKRQLAGRISSDCLAGPSELLVVADDTADPEFVAREMAAQAEHDPDAVVVALVTGSEQIGRIRAALVRIVDEQPRADIIRQALATQGALLTCDGLGEALAFAADFAPEHLLLLVDQPRRALDDVRAAGSVFLGPSSSVAFGDYMSGTNHVLPTGGQARSQSGLSVSDFVRWSTYQEIDAAAAARLGPATAVLAEAEGLGGHALAARALVPTDADPAPAPLADRRPLELRPEYGALSLYDPGRSPCEIDLTDNTNLFGQPPAAAAALRDFDAGAARRYPSLYGGEIKEAAAEYFGVPLECIATGCGSDDLIDSTIRAFCRPGDRVVFPTPTFSMIESFARMSSADPVGVPLAASFALDTAALVAAAGRITYVCRPNNPTGTLFERSAIETLVAATDGLVLIDEAYGDFCGDPLAAWAPTTDRVVVMRTLSKAFGLAGLRVGIAIGPPRLIGEIEKSRGPYKVSVVAETAAAAALRHDGDWIRETVAAAVDARARLVGELDRLGLTTWPSAANFVLVGAPQDEAAQFAARLLERGIGVRPFRGLPHAGDCIRVTVGPWPAMQRFIDAVEEILGS